MTYIIAVGIFITLAFFKTPYYIIGSILICIYFVYVFLVWVEEKKKKPTIRTGEDTTVDTESMNPTTVDGTSLLTEQKSNDYGNKFLADNYDDDDEEEEEKNNNNANKRITSFIGEIQVNYFPSYLKIVTPSR